MKLNNKGYMLVEIVLASVIAMSIGYYLLNLTFKFKNRNEDVYSSTELITDKIIITKNIMNDLEGKDVKFESHDDTSAILTADEQRKKILISNNTITYGNWNGTSFIKNDNSYYTKKLPNNIEIGKIVYNKKENSGEDDKAILTIPLSDIYSKNKYDIKIFAANPIIKVKVNYDLNGGSTELLTNLMGKYDGLLNNGDSHIASGTTWKNLVGGTDGKISSGYWGEDYLQLRGNEWVNLGIMNSKYQTIEATFEPTTVDLSTSHCIIGNWETGGGGIFIRDGRIQGEYYINSAYHTLDSGVTAVVNTKYHAALTYNGSDIIIYINGEKKASNPVSGIIGIPGSSTIMALGTNPSGSTPAHGSYFVGNIYNAAIYDKGLSKEEIKDEYNSKLQTNYKQVIYNKEYGDLPIPQKLGYSFGGWYLKSNFTEGPVDSKHIVSTKNNHTLYAKWDKVTIEDYDLNNSYYQFTAQRDGWYKVEAWGASGGQHTDAEPAGKGGYTNGYIQLKKGEQLHIYVGSKGQACMKANCSGGYNGGGASGSNSGASSGGGGGATDIRLVGGAWNDATSLGNRIMVAAGGGGAGNFSTANISSKYSIYGGNGGGLYGASGTSTNSTYKATPGANQTNGGTGTLASRGTTANGSFGYANQTSPDSWYGGGGGSGWYAGAQGYGTGGSGGSSYIAGFAGVNGRVISSETPTDNTKSSPNGVSGNYIQPYFIYGKMIPGVNTGDGKAKISYYGDSKPPRVNEKLKKVRYVKDCTTGNSNGGNARFWEEIQVIAGGLNVAKGKKVYYDGKLVSGNYKLQSVVDGQILNLGTDIYDNTSTGETCVTIDLGREYNDEIDEIAVWHIWDDGRTYYNNKTLVSADGSNWETVINTNEPETSQGKRVSAYE